MRVIDERFLTTHPRTLLWWKQRDRCSKCVHCSINAVSTKSNADYGMSCAVSQHGPHNASCMQARDEGKKCGPHALLFVKQKAPHRGQA